jgi:type III secretory pathway lipoprotein EscJ
LPIVYISKSVRACLLLAVGWVVPAGYALRFYKHIKLLDTFLPTLLHTSPMDIRKVIRKAVAQNVVAKFRKMEGVIFVNVWCVVLLCDEFI